EVAAFLRGQDIIIGPGRGSSVSSLVAYLLEITSLDPLQHKLFFERFLNEQRKTLPDIDMDVENQEEVFNYLRKKYSSYQVARIMGNRIKKNPSFAEQNLWFAGCQVKPLKTGVIINERSLAGSIPVKLESDFLVSLFEEEQLAQLGFKKYDFLSLKETLGFVTLIKNLTSHQHLPAKLPTYQEVDLADPKTWELLNNLCLTGIFQLDTPAARSLFLRFRPQNFAELVLFLALNRPGARRRAEEIISQKNQPGKSPFVSPALQKILAETFGLIIFEEQISQILALVADCSFATADLQRREIAVKGQKKQSLIMGFSSLKKYQANFFAGLLEERNKNGLYRNWEEFLSRTSECLGVDIATLEQNSQAIFRYLQIRQKIPTVNNNDLPFLYLPT
ncbi:10095_t:CDS:2, partial [Racocetra persica]